MRNLEKSRAEQYVRAARVCAAITVVAGITCLVGYALGIRELASVLRSLPATPPGTAIALVVAGVALWLVARPAPRPTTAHRIGRSLGAAVAVFGALTLVEYLIGADGTVHEFLFPELVADWRNATVPGRPTPTVGFALLIAGATLFLIDADRDGGHRAARVLAPCGLLIAVVAVLGNLYNVTDPSGRTGLPGPAPQTTLVLLVLSFGIVISRPGRPGVRPFTSSGPGGITVRRIGPGALVVAALIGVVLGLVEKADLSLRGVAVTLAMTSIVVLIYVALLYTGGALDRAGRQQQHLAETLRDNQDFSEAVLESLIEGIVVLAPDGQVLRVTPRWCEITGYQPEQVLGSRPPFVWWPPEITEARMGSLEGTLRATTPLEFDTQLVRVDGVRIDILATTSPILNDDGTVRHIVTTVRDLTDRNRDERERRRMAEQLDHLFAMSNDLMCISSTDGYLKRVNPAWERLFGYTEAELLSRPYIEFVHPEDLPASMELAAAMAEGRLATVEAASRFRCSDGSYRWINFKGTLAPDEDLIYAIGRDVTEQQRANEASALLAAIVDSTDEAIIGMNLDGTITSWNGAAQRIYGYAADEVIDQSIRILFPLDRLDECDAMLAQVNRGDPVRDFDTVRIRKDGTRVHVGLSISPVRDANGDVVGAASIVRDISERRRAEEQFRRLALKAPVAMLMVTSSGAIRLVNEQTERLFGYAAGELIGEQVELLIPQHLREYHAVQRERYTAAPAVRSVGSGRDLYGQRRDGSQFPVEIGLAPLDTDEGQLVSAVIHDITDRKQVQLALAAARDEAIAAAQLRSQFVAMVSHEIRTPMNGVIGLTNLLLESDLDRSQRRYADAIRVSARGLLTIINDILDFSKVEAGKVSLVEADFHLGKLVEEVVNAAAEASRDKHLEVIGYYAADLPSAVRGDEGRLRQVLLNLVGNAVKFTEHGEVTLRVEVGPEAPQRFTFSVTDTGIGIAPADLNRLFEAFTQVDSTTSRRFGGTGLGLTICRQLVELMGGRLDVESEPGHGSRFSFTIPLPPAADPTAHRTPRRDRLAGCRILIVDDNATNLRLLTDHARSWGMVADTAPDADTAMRHLVAAAGSATPYEVAVLDQHMSGTGGIHLAEQIIANPTIPKPYLIVLSSGAHQRDRLPAQPGVEVLPKPVGPSALYNCLLALRGPAAPAGEPGAGEGSTVDHGLVLLAEDNEINQMVAVDTLALLGYRADVAHNGVEAVELATAHEYQAILMDCQMPKMDGFEATRELRRWEEGQHEHGGRHTPVIALTAGALIEDRQRCLDAGMDDYLVKPLNPDDLRAALDRTATAH